tara:strand:+ start:459 stop:905 length:447 start_codon:yes stop_codon:yes gene_type:complete
MKKLLGIVVLGLLLSGNVYAYNFKETINQYSSINKGKVATIYVLTRCSALLKFTSAMILNESGKNKIYKMYTDYDIIAIHTATKVFSNHHRVSYDKARENLLERRMRLISFYREDAKELFLRNGSYLSGYIREDLETCVLVSNTIKNR